MGLSMNRTVHRAVQKATLLRKPGKGERELEKVVAAMGFPYERQKMIGPWYADFAIPQLKLVIEVDGAGHNKEKDARRDVGMAQTGWAVLRLSAEEVKRNPIGVLADGLLRNPAWSVSAIRNTTRAALLKLLREG